LRAGRGLPRRRSYRAAEARPPNLVLVAVAVVLLAWITADVLHGWAWTHLDRQTSDLLHHTRIRAAQRWQPLFVVKAAVWAPTQLGGRPVAVVLLPFVGWLAWRHRTLRPVLLLAVAGGLLVAAVEGGKLAVRRVPPGSNPMWHPAQSFPSGHVPTAVVCWGLLAWLAADYAVPELARRSLAVLRWAAPVLTGAGMLLLDYHWLSDVVAGLALGVLLLAVLHAVDRLAMRDWPGRRQAAGWPGPGENGSGASLPAPGRSPSRR
jgi:membrane-associated phospholipid phosphatase